MQQILLAIFCLLTATLLNAQTALKKGYFIDNNDNKLSCFISTDLKRNLNTFSYKENDTDTTFKIGRVQDVQEFGIVGEMRFIRATLEVDQSNNKNGSFLENKNPIWKTETVFLEYIVDGEADLFYYTNDRIKRFFYRTGEGPIIQLVYLKYLTNSTSLTENNQYKQSLITVLNCKSISKQKILNLSYTSSSLKKIFIEYNKCKQVNQKIYEKLKKRQGFKFKLKTGASMGMMEITDLFDDDIDVDLGSDISLANFGIEFEYTLPFKTTDDWTVRLEMLIGDSYNVRKTISPEQVSTNDYVEGKHQVFEMPIGFRRYFSLNNNMRLFANVAFNITFGGSDISYETNRVLKNRNESSNFRFGAGINYKKWDFELLMKTKKTATYRFINEQSTYTSYGVFLAYQIF
jgi:hypothetical protein